MISNQDAKGNRVNDRERGKERKTDGNDGIDKNNNRPNPPFPFFAFQKLHYIELCPSLCIDETKRQMYNGRSARESIIKREKDSGVQEERWMTDGKGKREGEVGVSKKNKGRKIRE